MYKDASLQDDVIATDVHTFISGSSHVCIEQIKHIGKIFCVGSNTDGETDVPLKFKSQFDKLNDKDNNNNIDPNLDTNSILNNSKINNAYSDLELDQLRF